MVKILSLLLTLTLVFVLAACKNENDISSNISEDTSITQSDDAISTDNQTSENIVLMQMIPQVLKYQTVPQTSQLKLANLHKQTQVNQHIHTIIQKLLAQRHKLVLAVKHKVVY